MTITKYRTKITTKTNNIHCCAFFETSQAEFDAACDLFENIGKMSYIKIEDANGDTIFIRGDSIESVSLERSKA